jgi:hypothetical protein
MLGAHLSSKGADRYIRPVLVAVLAISALGLLGVSNGWLLAAAVAAVVILAVVLLRMRSNALRVEASRPTGPEPVSVTPR